MQDKDRSRKAADDLSVALPDVTMEAKQPQALKELKSLLAATSTACSTPASSTKIAPAPDHGFDQRLQNGTPQSASQRWMTDKPRMPSSRRRYSIGEPGKLKGGFSQSARMGSLAPKERVFASLSNIANLKSAADAAMENFDDEFNHPRFGKRAGRQVRGERHGGGRAASGQRRGRWAAERRAARGQVALNGCERLDGEWREEMEASYVVTCLSQVTQSGSGWPAGHDPIPPWHEQG